MSTKIRISEFFFLVYKEKGYGQESQVFLFEHLDVISNVEDLECP